jgi:hypothetical protein
MARFGPPALDDRGGELPSPFQGMLLLAVEQAFLSTKKLSGSPITSNPLRRRRRFTSWIEAFEQLRT